MLELWCVTHVASPQHHVYHVSANDGSTALQTRSIEAAVLYSPHAATAETVESHYAIATGMLPVLSEQQVLDCTPNVANCGGTGGCGGGTPALGFDHIIFKGLCDGSVSA